ncbi:MAG: Ger(x)C family spore germination protein [Eubacteriaceae bacterium]
MKTFFFLLIILVFSIIILTGCGEIYQLNELAIITALGIDLSDEGYLITAQIINPGEIVKEKATSKTSVTTYRTYGKTIFEALRRLQLEIPRRIYFAHLRVLVYGEELARTEGIGKTLDLISRDHEMRTDFYIVIAKDTKAEKLLNILTPLEEIPSNKIFSGINMSEELWAATHQVQLDELINNIASHEKEPVVPGIILKGNADKGMDISNLEKVDVPTTVQIRYFSVFKNDKLIGWLSEEESIGYNHITGGVKSTIVTVPWEDGKISIELTKTDSTITGKVKNQKPIIEIEYWVEGNVGELECDIELSNTDKIYELEKLIEKEIKKNMKETIIKVQADFESDIFGFGEAIHRSEPEAWKKLKIEWDKEFVDLEVDVQVTAKIRGSGKIIESFQSEFSK